MRGSRSTGSIPGATPPPSRPIELESTWDDLLRTLDGNAAKILEVVKDVDLPRSFANGANGRSYHYMRRIHTRRGEPYCIMEMYLASEYYERASDRFDVEMVITILSQMAGANLKRMT